MCARGPGRYVALESSSQKVAVGGSGKSLESWQLTLPPQRGRSSAPTGPECFRFARARGPSSGTVGKPPGRLLARLLTSRMLLARACGRQRARATLASQSPLWKRPRAHKTQQLGRATTKTTTNTSTTSHNKANANAEAKSHDNQRSRNFVKAKTTTTPTTTS